MPPGVSFSYIKVNRIGVPFEFHVIPNKVYDEDGKKEVLTTDWITGKEWKSVRRILKPVVQTAAKYHKEICEGHMFIPPDDPDILESDKLVLGIFYHNNNRNRHIPSIENSLKDPTSPYWWVGDEAEEVEDDDEEDGRSRRIQICRIVVKVCILGGRTIGEGPAEQNESLSKALKACQKNYNNDYVNGDYDQGPYDNEVEQFQLGRVAEPVPGINEVIKNVNTTSTDPKIIEEQWNSMSNYFEERDDDTDSFTGIRSSESDDDEVDEDEELPDIDDVGPIRPQPVYELPLEYKNKITMEPEKSKKSDAATPTRTSRSSGRGRRRGESCMELVTASGQTIDILGEIRNETRRSKTRAGSTSAVSKPKPPKTIEGHNTLRHIESNRKSSISPTKRKKKKKRRSSSRSPHHTKSIPTTAQPQLPVSTKEVRRSPDVTSTTSTQSPSKARRRSVSESALLPETSASKRNLNLEASDDSDEVVITKEKARPRRKERQLLAANKIKIEKESSTSPQRRPSLTASPERRAKEKEPLPEWDPEMPILQPQPFHYTSDMIINSAPSLRPEQSPVSRKERMSKGRRKSASALSATEKKSSRRKSNSEIPDAEAATDTRRASRVTFSETVQNVKPKKRKSSVVLSLERASSPKVPAASSNTADNPSTGKSKSPIPAVAAPSRNLVNTSSSTDTAVTRAKEKETEDGSASVKKSEKLKKRKKRDKRHKELKTKSGNAAVPDPDPSKTPESAPRKESSNDASSSEKRKRKKKRLERESMHNTKPRSERLAKRRRMEKFTDSGAEEENDSISKAKPVTLLDSSTPAVVGPKTVTVPEFTVPSRPSSVTASSFISSPEDIPSYAGKSLIEVMNELSNSSLDDRSKSPMVSTVVERSKSPSKVVIEEPNKPERAKSPLESSYPFGSPKSAFVSTSASLTSAVTATATTQISTQVEANNTVIIVVPAPMKVSQTTQTDDGDMDVEMYPSSRFSQHRPSSSWNMKVVDEEETETKTKGLKALALVSLAYGDDDADPVVQKDDRDSDYDKPNRIMAELHESALRINSPPPVITVDDSDPEDAYALFDLTDDPPIKRELEFGIKKEVDIPAKYDLYEDTSCLEDPFLRLHKIEVDSDQEFAANDVSDTDEIPFSPEDSSSALHYSPPSNFYEPDETYEDNTSEPEVERNSPEPCCSKSLQNNYSLEMPPPSMPPPKSPRKSAAVKRKMETDQSKALMPVLPKNLEQAALAAAGVNQHIPDVETFEIMRNPKVLRHTLNKIHQAQTESFPEDDIRRVISGDYSDVTEVCSVRYANKKPEMRKRNSQGIKMEDEEGDGDDNDSQSHHREMDALAVMGSELLSKEVQRRSKKALQAQADLYVPQGDQYDLSQQSMCFLNVFGPDYAKSSRSFKQWKEIISDMTEHQHRKIFQDIALKLHAILRGEYGSERFDMWKRDDPELEERYIVARDSLFSDNTVDHYSDHIRSEFDSVMSAVTEKFHNCAASDARGIQYRTMLETLVLIPETLTMVLATVANISLEQAALVMNRGKHAPPVEPAASGTYQKALLSSRD